MAFLCPSRLGRSKQKHEINSSILDRISDEVGFDPLVKFELARYNANNPEAIRIILHNYTTCSPDELTVRQGQKVHILFREGDWAYVLTTDKKEGFIPYTACAKLVGVTSSKKTTKVPSFQTGSDNSGSGQKQSDRINNNTYNVKNDKSVVIHHIHNEQLHVSRDSLLSTDWSNESHQHQAVIQALKTKCVSQSSDQYDDNRNLIESYLRSSPYEKLPKFLEVFNSLQAEDGHDKKEDGDSDMSHRKESSELSPRHAYDSEISPRTVFSSDENENSFISEFSTELNADDTYVVMYDFRGRHREDIDVERDEMVVVLERDDPFWFWIRKLDGSEGYVPSNYIGHFKDPKVIAKQRERHHRDPRKSGHSTHHNECRCTDCTNMSPRTDTSSVASSTLNSETKTRPPKPPRTRIKVPRDSTKTSRNKTQSSSRRQNSSDHRDQRKQSNGNKFKFSSHHLSLENVSVHDEQGGSNSQMKPSESSTDLHHTRKKSSRQRRPNYREYRSQSTRSYTFEESKDYFDAYFCDEPDPNFKPQSNNKTEVVNVAEILKQRNADVNANKRSVVENKSNQRNMWMKNGSSDNGHNVLNLRQYMQTLPSTEIGGDNVAHNDLLTDNTSKHHETRRDKREKRSSDHPQRLDWSFGYPRKQRSTHNSRCSSTPDPNVRDIVLPKGTKRIGDTDKGTVKTVGSQTDLKDVGVKHNALEDPSDQMFLDLLNATDNLLEVSEKILSSSKAPVNNAETDIDDKGGDRRSSSSETDDDVNEKCSHFIMNQVIDTNGGQLTNRSEASCTVKSDVSGTCGIKTSERNNMSSDDVFIESPHFYATNHREPGPTASANDCQQSDLQDSLEDSVFRDIDDDNNNHLNTDSSNSRRTSKHNKSDESHSNKKVHPKENSMKKSSLVNDEEEALPKTSVTYETRESNSPITKDTNELVDDPSNYMDVRGVTEFVVQYDYEPEPDSGLAMCIYRNDILHISLDIQEDESWYWAYSPRLRTYGYVPRDFVKIPLVTII